MPGANGRRSRRRASTGASLFFFAGLIHVALPNVTIIHAMRDPLDTCVSNFSKLFAQPQNHSYDLAELGAKRAREHPGGPREPGGLPTLVYLIRGY
jgi:hypothetical protein